MAINIGGKTYELTPVDKAPTNRPLGKKRLLLVMAVLLWTLFNCIQPPFEGLQLIPAVTRSGYEKTHTVSPAHYTTVLAGRWFIWSVPESIAYDAQRPIRITRINITMLLTEYVGGLSLIGIGYLAVCFWSCKKPQ